MPQAEQGQEGWYNSHEFLLFWWKGNSTALKLNVRAGGILDKAMLHGCVHLLSPLPLSGQSKGEKAAGWSNAVLLSAVWCSLLSLHPEEKVEPQARLLVLKRQSAAFGAGIEPGPESFKSI